jgi:hypothetical protein
VKPEYEPQTTEQALGYLVEECGEVLAAVGKTQRWGLDSRDPDDPGNCRTCERFASEHGRCQEGCDDRCSARCGCACHTCDAYIDPRETNREWILRELTDLEGAIERVRARIL